MKKRIIVCFDGTGNTFEPTSLSDHYPSNVLKLARMIAPIERQGKDDIHQVVLYLPGVGTSGTYDRCINGITGHGVELKLLMAYQFITDNYNFEDRDDVYLFGFSRGAFAARLLAGFLDVVKVIPKERMYDFGRIYESYKQLAVGDKMQPEDEKEFGSNFELLSERHRNEPRIIPVLFLGVWDTVTTVSSAAQEVTVKKGLKEKFDLRRYLVEKSDEERIGHPAINTLPRYVSYAYQALALHEIRSDFLPSLWEKSNGGAVVQTWFPGSHSDIGGGYANSDLSSITLEWMIARARQHKLYFNGLLHTGAATASAPRFLTPINESWHHGIWNERQKQERTIGKALGEFRHLSVEARLTCKPDPEYILDHQAKLKRIDAASLELEEESKSNFQDQDSVEKEVAAYKSHLESQAFAAAEESHQRRIKLLDKLLGKRRN